MPGVTDSKLVKSDSSSFPRETPRKDKRGCHCEESQLHRDDEAISTDHKTMTIRHIYHTIRTVEIAAPPDFVGMARNDKMMQRDLKRL